MELEYPGLMVDAARVLRTLVILEREVAAHGGRWFASRIVPYRTTENVIDGVVITFSEITRVKVLQAALAAAGSAPSGAAASGPAPQDPAR